MLPMSLLVGAKAPKTGQSPWFLHTGNRDLEPPLFYLTCPLCGNKSLPVSFLTLQFLSY